MKNIVIAIIFSVSLLSGQCLAGAWPQEKGHGQSILTGYHSTADRQYFSLNETAEIDKFSKTEFSLYLEHGLTNRFTFILAPKLTKVESDSETVRSGLGRSELGLRYTFSQNDKSVLSAQASYLVPGRESLVEIPEIYSEGDELDLRVLYGRNLSFAGRNGFLDLQAAWRVNNAAAPSEWRADATLGVDITDDLVLIAQSFNVVSDGAGEDGFPAYRYHKLQLSLSIPVTQNLSLQAGANTTIAGENALQETAVFTALTKKY